MEESSIKLGGAAGGFSAVCRGVGWVVFTLLTGRPFTNRRIASWLKLIVGNVVISLAVGATVGSYSTYLEAFYWRGDSWVGVVVGAVIGCGIGIFMAAFTDDSFRAEFILNTKQKEAKPGSSRLGNSDRTP